MSYYPTERRGGCMESLSRCCRQAYVYPVDTRKLLYASGAVVGVILVAVVWTGLSSSGDSPNAQPFQGSVILHEAPLIVGCNFFPSNLRDQVHNNITKVQFNHNLKNDSVFGIEHCKSCQTDLQRLQSGLVKSQIWNINVPCNAMYKDAVSLTLEQLDAVARLINSYPDNLALIRSSSEVDVSLKRQQIDSILAVTSGHSIDGRLPVLRSLQSLGVRIMALTSTCSNAWATSFEYTDTANDTGLSSFGKAVVKEMNRLGILIDLSGSSYQTQIDVLNVTTAPVIFSHSAAYSLANNKRNIKDDVLDKLKGNKGVVMVTFAQQYLNSNINNSNIHQVIAHINYIKNKTGVAGVGIGAEFDAAGLTYPPLLSDVSTFPALFNELAKNSWTYQDDLKNLAGGNFIRVLQAVEKYAKEAISLPVDETYVLPENSTCYSDYDARNIAPVVTTHAPTPTTVATTTVAPTPSTTPIQTTSTIVTAVTATAATTTGKPNANPSGN